MAKVQWENEDVGNRRDHLKFKLGWTRFCILDLEAEMDRIHYDRGYQMCTKHGSKKEYVCGNCNTKLIPNTDLANPGSLCPRCNAVNGPKRSACQWCDAMKKEQEDRFGTNVLVYKIDPESGTLLVNSLAEMTEKMFRITWWPFAADKWGIIRMTKKTRGDLRKIDFMYQCTEEKYQRGTLMPCNEAWWLMDPNLTKLVGAAYKQDKVEDLGAKICNFVPYELQLDHINNVKRDNRGGDNRQPSGPPQFNPGRMGNQGGFAPPAFAPPPGLGGRSVDDLLAGGPTVPSAHPAPTPATPPPAAPTPVETPSQSLEGLTPNPETKSSTKTLADLDELLESHGR